MQLLVGIMLVIALFLVYCFVGRLLRFVLWVVDLFAVVALVRFVVCCGLCSSLGGWCLLFEFAFGWGRFVFVVLFDCCDFGFMWFTRLFWVGGLVLLCLFVFGIC